MTDVWLEPTNSSRCSPPRHAAHGGQMPPIVSAADRTSLATATGAGSTARFPPSPGPRCINNKYSNITKGRDPRHAQTSPSHAMAAKEVKSLTTGLLYTSYSLVVAAAQHSAHDYTDSWAKTTMSGASIGGICSPDVKFQHLSLPSTAARWACRSQVCRKVSRRESGHGDATCMPVAGWGTRAFMTRIGGA